MPHSKMDVHQTITGALNHTVGSYAIGSVEGINFIACAVGCDVVILGSEFQRVQVLSGLMYGNVQVTAVDCCCETGKIAAVYQDTVRIFEPTPLVEHSSTHKLDYMWFQTGVLDAHSNITNLSWNLNGMRVLLSTDTELQLWQHDWLSEQHGSSACRTLDQQGGVKFKMGHDEDDEGFDQEDSSCGVNVMPPSDKKDNASGGMWSLVWRNRCCSTVSSLKFSPDGLLFATVGHKETMVKVWYEDKIETGEVQFSFLYLHHPFAVHGFEWRKTGRYMPRHCVGNVLVTWCSDNVCRIWNETLLPDSGLYMSEQLLTGVTGIDHGTGEEQAEETIKHSGQRKLKNPAKQSRRKFVHRLKHLKTLRHSRFNVHRRKRSGNARSLSIPESSLAQFVPSSMLLHEYCEQLGLPIAYHFHLAASINTEETDAFTSSSEGGVTHKTFGIHWLNNKELAFSLAVEKLLAEHLLDSATGTFSGSGFDSGAASAVCPGTPAEPVGIPDEAAKEDADAEVLTETPQQLLSPVVSHGAHSSPDSIVGASSVVQNETLSADVLETRLESLLHNWHETADVLYGIHPKDGSLLIWTVDYLDELCREAQVNFSACIPHAVPLTDAASLNFNLQAFNPHDPAFVHVVHSANPVHFDVDMELSMLVQPRDAIFLLTCHENGSLNLWHMTVDEHSNFSTILNIDHKSRMCGHRFRITDLSCHPVLPLLLTSSHHCTRTMKSSGSKDSSPEAPSFNSELILWKVDSVGPLFQSGGVRELSRISSTEHAAFSTMAWFPAILPSSTLGHLCNSPSSCFVASDGHRLHIYQAVIDARMILSVHKADNRRNSIEEDVEISDPHCRFDIVSTQSTARPGCMIDLGVIAQTERSWEHTPLLLLHVFQGQTLRGGHTHSADASKSFSKLYMSAPDSVRDFSKARSFHDSFYVVAITKDTTDSHKTKLQMWHVELSSQQNESKSKEHCSSLASKVVIKSSLVCDQILRAGSMQTEIIDAKPSAGHLASSSIYPACHAPYLIATSSSDDKIRFWYCEITDSLDGSATYEWNEWVCGGKELNYDDSTVELEGKPLALSCAYSGRFACAADHMQCFDKNAEKVDLQIAIFECESTGGMGWQQEDVLYLCNINIPRAPPVAFLDFHHHVHSPLEDIKHENSPGLVRKSSSSHLLQRIPSLSNASLNVVGGAHARSTSPTTPYSDMRRAVQNFTQRQMTDYSAPKPVVRLDWVPTEDGSHILTVGVGSKIFVCAAVAENVAQQNVTISIESTSEAKKKKKPLLRQQSSIAAEPCKKLVRWHILRSIELRSFDGRPPLPVMLGWVRDGILIVGMESEMRVYSQWNISHREKQDASPVKKLDLDPKLKLTAEVVSKLEVPSSKQLQPQKITPSASVLDLARNARETSAVRPTLKKLVLSDAGVPTSNQDSHGNDVADLVRHEGLFEAARVSLPMLPQYHPKQLMQLLNGGRTRRVKAILLNVLRWLQRNQKRSGSGRRASFDDDTGGLRRRSFSSSRAGLLVEESTPDFFELNYIPPLALHALLAADTASDQKTSSARGSTSAHVSKNKYEDLFSGAAAPDLDLGDLADPEDDKRSNVSDEDEVTIDENITTVAFTAAHTRALSSFLTHARLPGLSSVDQMHLLAVADTISSFSSDEMDKLSQVNAAYARASAAIIETTTGTGYASVGGGSEAIDDCGLRYLMALKQHEYLLKCLPISQRQKLQSYGLAYSHIIWAYHSETETELLNTVSAAQTAVAWKDLKMMGAGWWLRSQVALRLCIEKVAKSAFQTKQDPMDAAVFYLAMKKKNVLWGLYRSVGDAKMTDFFSQNFSEEKWCKAAMKNAFVLMGKQRFEHAAAFFLLGGSLQDALRVCLNNLNDIQLAMVIVRLHVQDNEKQTEIIHKLLLQFVFGYDGVEADFNVNSGLRCNNDPFLKSMAFWMLKMYDAALNTLLEDDVLQPRHKWQESTDTQIADVFNFYSYLRSHPLVVRHKMAEQGIVAANTDKFLSVARTLESLVTGTERKLYFKTAYTHLKSGCPLLALEVLMKLPKRYTVSSSNSLQSPESDFSPLLERIAPIEQPTEQQKQSVASASGLMDWGESMIGGGSSALKEEELELKWSDDEDKEEDADKDVVNTGMAETPAIPDVRSTTAEDELSGLNSHNDIMAQQLKFIACLKMIMEELSTISSGFDVDGGQLRCQLYAWLEKEFDVLRHLCSAEESLDVADDQQHPVATTSAAHNEDGPLLHEALRSDLGDLESRIASAHRRRLWLSRHQPLIRTLAAYCSLHGQGIVGLASARIELLFLLQELQQELPSSHTPLLDPIPVNPHASFPLLTASQALQKTDVSDPIRYLHSQTADMLSSIINFDGVSSAIGHSDRVFAYYNLAQCLSACLYESLCDIESFVVPSNIDGTTSLLLRQRAHDSVATVDDEKVKITSAPSKWPGLTSYVRQAELTDCEADGPQLHVLVAEAFVAVYIGLAVYALSAYDARWLFRLVAHTIDARVFEMLFGGAGEKRLVVKSAYGSHPSVNVVGTTPTQQPQRPPPPRTPRVSHVSESAAGKDVSTSVPPSTMDPIRAKFNSRVFGNVQMDGRKISSSEDVDVRESYREVWVPPLSSIIAHFTTKPSVHIEDFEYDSDDSVHSDSEHEDYSDMEGSKVQLQQLGLPQHSDPRSFAWRLLRHVVVKQVSHRIQRFLTTCCSIDRCELALISPLLHRVTVALDNWAAHTLVELEREPCPDGFLPQMDVDTTSVQGITGLQKYRCALRCDNTPFTESAAASPVKRLWLYLIRQEHLMETFVRVIFPHPKSIFDTTDGTSSKQSDSDIPHPLKIVQREQDPITSFSLSSCQPGYIAVATNREIQEMNIAPIICQRAGAWLDDGHEMQMAASSMKRTALAHGDDFMVMPSDGQPPGMSYDANTAQNRAGPLLRKRDVQGVKRMEAHPNLPYYLTGSTDGSVTLWEWGAEQAIATPRKSGQYAKVTRVRFSPQGSKFGATDGDGTLSMWLLSKGVALKKPFLSVKCHSKTTSDFVFAGSTSSLVITCGQSANDQNVCLWDLLLPPEKAMVQSWSCHVDGGASALLWVPQQHAVYSAGKQGDMCIIDIRQRAIRQTVKIFDHAAVKSLALDPHGEFIVAGSSDGDLKVYSVGSHSLLHTFVGDHASRGAGFSLRNVGAGAVQGVAQVYVDRHRRLMSCGADASLKLRALPPRSSAHVDSNII